MNYAKKNFQLVWLCRQLLYGFLAKGPFAEVSRQLTNNKGKNMIPGAVHSLKLRKTSGDRRWRLWNHHRLKWDPLPSKDVGRIASSTSWRDKEGKDGSR